MKTETNDIMKISAFRALVDEATNASFDCGEYEFESGEDTETYDKILEKSNDAREKLVSVYSELERENARLRDQLKAVRELCTTDHESKERFIARVLLCLPNVQAQR